MAAAAAAATLRSAAARRFSSSASTVTMREVIWSHKFTIDGCKASRKLRKPVRCCSKDFDVAGCSWRISCEPNGTDGDYISFFLNHDHPVHSSCEECSAAEFKFTLLDQAGNPVPEYSKSLGFHFIRWIDLEESGCLKDDRFSVRCDITGIKTCLHDDDGDTAVTAANQAQVVAVPPSNLHVHRWLIAVRCPVLDAELEGTPQRFTSGGTFRRFMKIEGMESKMFEAMLHFLYTDALPKIGEQEAVPMAQGLIVAAHRYKLDRLKLMCEEMLCRRVDMGTVAGSLAVAEKHGCRALKAACMELLGRPGNLKAVMAAEGFEKVKADCAGALLELFMKQLPE
ncbi:unnamed protein product [Urochloa humidicola]